MPYLVTLFNRLRFFLFTLGLCAADRWYRRIPRRAVGLTMAVTAQKDGYPFETPLTHFSVPLARIAFRIPISVAYSVDIETRASIDSYDIPSTWSSDVAIIGQIGETPRGPRAQGIP